MSGPTHYERCLATFFREPYLSIGRKWFQIPETEAELDRLAAVGREGTGEIPDDTRHARNTMSLHQLVPPDRTQPAFKITEAEKRAMYVGAGILLRFLDWAQSTGADGATVEAAGVAGMQHFTSQLMAKQEDPLSLAELLRSRMHMGMAALNTVFEIRAGNPAEHGTTPFIMHGQASAYARTGKHTFTVSEGLAQRLLLMELRGVKGADFRLPYRSLYLEIPESLGLGVVNRVTGTHRMCGVYLLEDVTQPTEDLIDHVTELPQDAGARRCVRVMIVGRENENSDGIGDDALQHFVFTLGDDKDLHDLTAEIKLKTEMSGYENAEDIRTLMRWVFNAVFYATSAEVERDHVVSNPEARALWERHQKAPRGSSKRRELLDRFREKDPRERIALGRSVTVDRSLPRTAAGLRLATGPGRGLCVRTLVCGHWRRFAVGAGRKDRIWKWLAPFWRGPELGPVNNPPHVLR